MITAYTAPDIVEYTLEGIDDLKGMDVYKDDIHHAIFNTDYFIIGTEKAKNWLEKNVGVFKAIDTIKEYENFNFGNVSTDFSCPEKVVNMYVYIAGEEILFNSRVYNNYKRERADDEFLTELYNEIELNYGV